MTCGSCFSGIGALDLGLQRAGFEILWMCENDPFARRVLAKHWPEVPCYDDIRTLDAGSLARPDLLAGGFPCTDVSNAGKRAGIDGEQSGLWREMFRLVRDLRPRYVLAENTASLLCRGFDRVLRDLASVGFDAEWSVVSACSMGAPHTRERVFILAYPAEQRVEQRGRIKWQTISRRERNLSHWQREPTPARVADGAAGRLDRCRVIGNAVVPAVGEWIGRRILEADRRTG